MIFKKILILFFITSSVCQGKSAKRLSILHLGEVKDEYEESNYSIPNYYISKAMHNLMETKEMENYDIQLTPFYFDPESDDEENELGQICKTIADLNNGSLTQDLIIDTTRNPELRQIAAKIASNYRIPVVFVRSINDPDNEEDYSIHLIKFTPPNLDLHLLVEEIILSKKITDVAVLYDRLVEFPWKELRAELNFLNIPCVFIASRVLIDDIQKQLETVNNMYFKNVFILGKWPAYKKYLTRGQNVYVIHQNIQDRNKTDANFLQVDVFVRIFNRVNHKEVIGEEPRALEAAFYYELAYAAVQSLRRMKESSVDAEEHSDCSSPGNKKYPNYLKYLKKFKDPIFDGSQTRSANENLLSFEIVYKGLTVGHWSSKHKVHITQKNVWEGIQPRRHYKVLAKVKHPFVYSSNGTHWGYLIDLLAMIASVQNFTYDLTVLPDTQAYTSQIFINKISSDSFDIGLGPVYETRYSDHVSFSIPYYKMVGIKFVMKNTKDDSIFTFITVLEPIVWTCILSAFFINSFLLWASERFSPYSYRNNKEKYAEDEEVRDFTAKESLWFCLTSITPEGGGIVPKHISGRLIVVTWWLFGFIILASYTANLAAFLTLSKMKNPIQNFDDLYRQFKMRYAPLEGSDELDYFHKLLHIENDNREKIFSKKEYPMPRQYDRMIKIINKLQPLNNTDSALEMVYESKSATEGFAFIVDSADARYLLMTRCKLIDVEEEEAKRNLVIVTPNINTILKYDIDNALAIIQRMQWYRDLEKKWWDNNPYKSTNCTELEDDDEGIGIYNIGGVFIMIFVGIGMSMITMAYDYVRYKYRTEGKNKPATLEEEVISVTSASSAQRVAIAPSESTIPEVNEDDKGDTRLQRRNVNKF